MKSAIGYIRISTKDQSNFSLSGQKEYIDNFCQREEIQLLETFKDDGFSAKNFDRPSWKELKSFIQKHHRSIDYLIVCKYDRFSRNTAEGLIMIEELEKKFNIIILSVFEKILIDPSSPYFFKQRADMLVTAEFELHVIRERTTFGIHQSAAAGRHPFRAPWGYKNERDENNKPILIKDQEKEPIVKYIFEAFLIGTPKEDISKKAREMGYPRKGKSAILRVLKNPVYAGMVKVPSFKEKKAEIKPGIHEPMIPKHYFYEAQNLLSGKNRRQTPLNPNVPLRGLLRCDNCGEMLTGGKSKGRNAYYYYYKCRNHAGSNNSAKKVHDKFEELLKLMSLPQKHIIHLKQTFEKKFQEQQKKKKSNLITVNNKITDIQQKLESLEEKFISDQISKEVYNRWNQKLTPEYNNYLSKQSKLQESDQETYRKYKQQIPYLEDIHHIYHLAELPEKRELVRNWFEHSLTWSSTHFETNYIMSLFTHNLKKMNELNVLKLTGMLAFKSNFPVSSPSTPSFEPLDRLLILFQQITAA